MSTNSEHDSESTQSFDAEDAGAHDRQELQDEAEIQRLLSQRIIWSPREPQGIGHSSTMNPAQVQSQGFSHTLSHFPSPDLSPEARRQSIMAMDRKRRLTASNIDGGRRRFVPDSPHDKDDVLPHRSPDGSSSSTRPLPRQRRSTPGQVPATAEVIDLTSSPQASTTSVSANVRTSSISNTRSYTMPCWQPDSEVSECPICKRRFGLFFRRHHCRKCGRVVCNDCSPHRITIPRQFIVSPPGLDIMTSPATQTIDLTGDDEDDEEESASISANPRRQHSFTNSVLGGGEKVRLCNPCVPDPQPEPSVTYTANATIGSPELPRLGRDPPSLPRPRHHIGQRELIQPFPGMSVPNYPTFASQYQRRPHRPLSNTIHSTGGLPPFLPSASSSSADFERHHEHSPPALGSPFGGHARYYSLDASRLPNHYAGRSRLRSMLEEPSHTLRAYQTTQQPRVQINEDDICPICRRALPPRSPDGDETAREAHIMQCITARDPANQNMHGGANNIIQPPHRGPIHMLTFIATEKDCVGEEGNIPECSICMVEYDVGDQLARLECLCKFHRECISSWFGRKQECPVHKIT